MHRCINLQAAEKIKKDLIEKAKIKAAYAKLKAREERSQRSLNTSTKYLEHYSESTQAEASHESEATEPASLEPHPSRQALMDSSDIDPHGAGPTQVPYSVESERDSRTFQRRRKASKQVPFSREAREAELAKEEAKNRKSAAAAARVEREHKIAEREEWRRAMDKSSKTGSHGQMKLGRQSKPLLGKIRRMVMEENSSTDH